MLMAKKSHLRSLALNIQASWRQFSKHSTFHIALEYFKDICFNFQSCVCACAGVWCGHSCPPRPERIVGAMRAGLLVMQSFPT